VAAGCLVAAGCGSGSQQGQSSTATVGKSHKARKSDGPSKPGEESLGDMVAAVSASKGPPVELKFALPVRPEVGQVTDIDVALVTSQPVPESVSISFQVGDGLDIVDGSQMERIDKPAVGTPIRHVVRYFPNATASLPSRRLCPSRSRTGNESNVFHSGHCRPGIA